MKRERCESTYELGIKVVSTIIVEGGMCVSEGDSDEVLGEGDDGVQGRRGEGRGRGVFSEHLTDHAMCDVR